MEKHNCHCVCNVFNEILYCLFGLLVNEFWPWAFMCVFVCILIK